MSHNLRTACRCCLSSEDEKLFEMSDTMLFDEIENGSHNTKIINLYFEFCVDSANATLGPYNICKSCRQKLQNFSAFRDQCRLNNDLFQTPIKTEIPETLDYNVIVKEIKLSTRHQVTEVLISEVKSEVRSDNEDDIPLAKRKRLDQEDDSKDNIQNRESTSPWDDGISDISVTPNLKSEPDSSDSDSDNNEPVKTATNKHNVKILCLHCNKQFSSCDLFTTHIRSKKYACSWKGIGKCRICGEKNIKSLYSHLQDSHPGYTPQECLVCSEKFIIPSEVLNHMTKHKSADYTYKCQGAACGKWFTSRNALRAHIESSEHNPLSLKRCVTLTFNCPVCGLTAALQTLVQHIGEKHADDLTHKYYPCHGCRRIFLLSTDYEKHLKKGCPLQKSQDDRPKKELIKQCEKCAFRCSEDEELLCHELIKHKVMKETFRCESCPESFDTADVFVQHKRSKHQTSSLEATHICEMCGKGLPNANHYKQHMAVHSEKRAFRCDQCPADFKTRPEMEKHKILVHGHFGGYECHECGAKEFLLCSLKDHLLSVHFKALLPLACPLCNRRFIKKFYLQRHLASHSSEKKFPCTAQGCEKRYSTKTGLLNHVQTNHTLVRYECKFCDKKLATKVSMWKHIFVHRGFYPFNCKTCNYGCYPKDLMKTHLKKHNVKFDDAIHGYHGETVDQVLASGTKISEPENMAFFLNPENSSIEQRVNELMQHENLSSGRGRRPKIEENRFTEN